MYWWTRKNTRQKAVAVGILLAAASVFACTTDTGKTNAEKDKQFDIPDFFQQEVARLSKLDKEITKTVSKENTSETKKVHIQDWDKELAAFQAVDLNKTAYAGYIRKDSADHVVKITLDNEDADLSSVHIRYDEQDGPHEIVIVKKINNLLYNTTEKLVYRKDQGYKIEKQQHVWLLGSNHYTIEGVFAL